MMALARVTSTAGQRAAGLVAGLAAGRTTSLAAGRTTSLATGLAVGALLACGAPPRAPGTVIMASGADLEGMNPLATVHPLSRQVQRHVLFVTLVRADSALEPQPYFARRWRWSADRRRLTLATAHGLRWSDGEMTTARDAAFTLDAARDPATGYARAGDLAALDTVDAIDDTTLVLTFRSPQPALPPLLAELAIAPRHRLRDVPRGELRRSSFAHEPVGNGPFIFVSRRAGERWVFARNSAFPMLLGGPPQIERLVIAVVDEPATKFAGLVSGELDLAGISPGTAPLAARDSSLRALSYPVLFTHALVFNAARPAFADVRVRRALSLSVDRRRLVSIALAGQGTPASGPVPLSHPFAAPSLAAPSLAAPSLAAPSLAAPSLAAPSLAAPLSGGYDPATADSLLDAAGWRLGRYGVRQRDGQPLTIELLCVGSGDNLMEQLLQADLAARGVRATIRTRELGAFLAEARATPRRFDALVTGIPGDLALGYLGAMFDGRQRGGTLDYADWHSERLDQRFDRVRSAASLRALRQAWLEVQAELDHALPVAWLVHARGVQGVSRRLSGVEMDLRGELASVVRWRIAP